MSTNCWDSPPGRKRRNFTIQTNEGDTNHCPNYGHHFLEDITNTSNGACHMLPSHNQVRPGEKRSNEDKENINRQRVKYPAITKTLVTKLSWQRIPLYIDSQSVDFRIANLDQSSDLWHIHGQDLAPVLKQLPRLRSLTILGCHVDCGGELLPIKQLTLKKCKLERGTYFASFFYLLFHCHNNPEMASDKLEGFARVISFVECDPSIYLAFLDKLTLNSRSGYLRRDHNGLFITDNRFDWPSRSGYEYEKVSRDELKFGEWKVSSMTVRVKHRSHLEIFYQF